MVAKHWTLVNINQSTWGEQDWEVYDVNTGKTLEIVKGKSKGEVADAVYDKYADQGIGFQVRPYEDPATMTPRAKLAKRITTKKQEPIDYNYEIVNLSDVHLRVVDKFYADSKQEADKTFDKWLEMKGLPNDTHNYGYRPRKQDLNTAADNTERGEWEFYRTETGNVIDRVNDASRMQANAVRADIVRRYGHPDASVGMRRVDQQGVQDVEPDVAQNFSQPTTYEIYRRNAGNPTAIHRFQAATHPEAMAELERFRQSHPETAPYELSLRNVPA